MGLLASETIIIWLRAFTRMTAWCALGLTASTVGLMGSALLGSKHQILATMIFIVGVLIHAMSMIIMLYSARDTLQSTRELRHHHRAGIPETVLQPTRPVETILAALGPFLITYSVWGLVEERLRALFSANLIVNGLDAEAWSIAFDRWKFFLTVAIVVFLAKQVLQLVIDYLLVNRPMLTRAGTVLVVVMEATWIFSTFIVADRIIADARTWVLRRRLIIEANHLWYDFIDSLPHIPLLGWTSLDSLLRGSLGWITEAFIPGFMHQVAIPIVWLALTAVVHGWRQFSVTEILRGRTGDRLARSEQGVAALLTKELREKYLPVLMCLRLMLHAGPWFLGAYLIGSALLQFARDAGKWALVQIVGTHSDSVMIAMNTVLTTATDLVFLPLTMALYLAAFDRGVSATTGSHWERRRMQRATRVGNVTASTYFGPRATD